MARRCSKWEIMEHRRVIRWLRKHRNYFPLYQRMKNEVLEDPYSYPKMKGECSKYRRHKRGDLRLVYWISCCTIIIEGFGWRRYIYKILGCQ